MGKCGVRHIGTSNDSHVALSQHLLIFFVLMTTAYKLVWRLVQTNAKKRMLVGAIVFDWLAIPAFEITMAFITTDIVDGVCMPDEAHGSEIMMKTRHVFGFFVAYLLPLSVMSFCYSRIVYALRTKVSLYSVRVTDLFIAFHYGCIICKLCHALSLSSSSSSSWTSMRRQRATRQ